MKILRASCVALFVLCAAGCAGNGDGLDRIGRPLSGDSGQNNAPLIATFQSIQDNVFTPICTECHVGANAPEGLRLDAANSYNLLVGVPSSESPDTLRVKPSDPDSSYLLQKIRGIAAVGGQMPLGEPALPASTVAVIQQWITDGATQATTVPTATTALQILTASPAAGDVLASAPKQLIVSFDGELNASLIDANSVRLEHVSDTNVSDVSGEVSSDTSIASRLTIVAANPRTLLIAPQSQLGAGHYRLTLATSAGATIADMQTRALAKDYVLDFSVTDTR